MVVGSTMPAVAMYMISVSFGRGCYIIRLRRPEPGDANRSSAVHQRRHEEKGSWT
jgi:hypothetical protein